LRRSSDAEADSLDFTAVDVLPLLAVDDHVENLRALEGVLAPLGYPLLLASSGAEALRLLLEHDVALILLDVRMPELDGLETARLIKTRARTRNVPIVFLTAGHDDIGDILRGYGVGAVDYVLKPFDPELLRSKVAVFAELEKSRRALNRSETFLRAAFEAAPIGKTLLDAERRIVRANPAFARLAGRIPSMVQGVPIMDLIHAEDAPALSAVLDGVSRDGPFAAEPDGEALDLRLVPEGGQEAWVGIVASSIEEAEFAEPLLLVQWVDLSARRRAEQARAELLLEHAARSHAESIAERLATLQGLSSAIESLSLTDVLAELALRLPGLFGAATAEVQVDNGLDEPLVVRARDGEVQEVEPNTPPPGRERWEEAPVVIEGASVGALRLGLAPRRSLTGDELSLLRDVADRAALAIRRAQLHDREHRIAVELQRGLLPKGLPELGTVELAALYEVAGAGAEVGGDWYDAFMLPGDRLGVVVGDVAGRGIPAASTMGQLRSVTRAFALADDGSRGPAEALTQLGGHQLALGQDELFTVIYAIIDPREGTISWANAGHLPPLVRRASGETQILSGGEGLMGFQEIRYEGIREALGPSDILVFYTDGLVERRGESLDVGIARLADALASGPSEPQALCEHLLREVLEADRERYDDVTVVVARLR
jgi:PAS domain S-box-containing protein